MSLPERDASLQSLVGELQAHLGLCGEIHSLVCAENQQLKSATPADLQAGDHSRSHFLNRLTGAQRQIADHKAAWLRLPAGERARHPEVAALIRQNLDAIMKIVLLDRENEQLLLRHRLVPPSKLPPAQRQNPHYVARLYRNTSAP
jgi:hypothetical protein